MIFYPAIGLRNANCVRLRQGKKIGNRRRWMSCFNYLALFEAKGISFDEVLDILE